MISLDAGTVTVLMLASALAGLLVGILPAWRRLMSGGQRLPVWAFLRRRGFGVDGRAAVRAETRCALCGAKAQCEQLLAAGADSPVPECPNLKLLHER
jgi:hypothetical protein